MSTARIIDVDDDLVPVEPTLRDVPRGSVFGGMRESPTWGEYRLTFTRPEHVDARDSSA
jgi:hypothetical protein